MSDTYLNVTIYRGGTIDNPTLPIEIDELTFIKIDQLLGIADAFEVHGLNWYDEYTEAIREGDIIAISLGEADAYEEIIRGRVFNVRYPEDTIEIYGQGWGYFLVGPKVTRRYGDEDIGYILRDLIGRYAPNLKTNFLIDIGHKTGEMYSGAYKDLLYCVNELSGMKSYEWKVRTDREVVIFPDGLQIDFIDSFNEESDNENPDGWTEVVGTWYVISNRYYGSHTATSGITLIDNITTGTSQDIRCIAQAKTGGTYVNAILIYDYQSASNFKYAFLAVGSDFWKIGQYIGYWDDKATYGEALNANQDYRIRVTIVGTKVTFYGWDTTNEQWVEKCNYTWASIGTGSIGVAIDTAIAEFDDFVIYSTGNITLNSEDFLSHDIARRDFRDLINKQTVVGGNERLNDDFTTTLYHWGTIYNSDKGTCAIDDANDRLEIEVTVGGNEMRIWSNGTYKNFTCTMKVTIDADGTDDNFCFYYRGEGETKYYKVKFDAGNNQITLYREIGAGEVVIKQVSEGIATDTEYTFKIKAIDATHKIYVGGTIKIDVGDSNIPTSGKAGIGTEDGHIYCGTFDLISDRPVVATATDYTLIDTWGIKAGEPIRDIEIITRGQGLLRAQYELDLQRFLKTRGMIKDEGRIDIHVGDISKLNISECSISDVGYRIYGVQHIWEPDEEGGWVTFYSVAEDLPRVEDVIKRIILSQAALVTSATYITQLSADATMNLSVYNLYYYEAIYRCLYYKFQVDYSQCDFAAVW